MGQLVAAMTTPKPSGWDHSGLEQQTLEPCLSQVDPFRRVGKMFAETI